ncbi:MAG: GTPase Era, partial [Lachnospiraceae bacterium]|nr:GTPase Era [Lachnospiraceae bacterium]
MEKEPKKSGFVALVGRPNVGKSTLMNHLIGQKIAITSSKPQTTRNRIQTVYTDERGQIIFLDTPGIHKAKNKLGNYMVGVAERTLNEVDVILWLVEPGTFIGAGEKHIADQLGKTDVPVILVINKSDTIKNADDVILYIDAYKDICNFAEIVPLSALKGQNTKLLTELIFKYLPAGPRFYDEDTVTDQPMRQIASELVREKALRLLDDEIPHGIAVVVEKMNRRRSGITDIEATIICERESHKGIIIGKKGSMLKKIGYVKKHTEYVPRFCDPAPCQILDEIKNQDDRIIEDFLQKQKATYSLDFHDLISFAIYLLETDSEVREKWQNRLNYIMVDEFQDSSSVEMRLVEILSGQYHNLMIVGDPDQNIYEWRGSDVKLLVDFDKEHMDTKTIILNQNYRSTPQILRCANTLIEKNELRLKKDLFTKNADGAPVIHYHSRNDFEEMDQVIANIKRLCEEEGLKYSDFAR